MVDLYFSCRDQKLYPVIGSLYNQTEFTVQLFNFLDNIVSEFHSKLDKKHKQQADRDRKKLESQINQRKGKR